MTIIKKIDKALVERICNGVATHDDFNSLGRENVLSIKSDPYLPRRRMVQKTRPPSVEKEKRTVEHEASNGDQDRMGDVIDPRGWTLDNFKTNPVLLWSHNDSQPPIGKVIRARKGTSEQGRRGLFTQSKFHDEEKNPFAEMIWRMVSDGDLPAVSVGFMPMEDGVQRPETEEQAKDFGVLWPYGVKFVKQELLELSVVTVPALASALAKKLDQFADEGFSWAIINEFKRQIVPSTKSVHTVGAVEFEVEDEFEGWEPEGVSTKEIFPFATMSVQVKDPVSSLEDTPTVTNALLREIRLLREEMRTVVEKKAQPDDSAREEETPEKPVEQSSGTSRRRDAKQLFALVMTAASAAIKSTGENSDD